MQLAVAEEQFLAAQDAAEDAGNPFRAAASQRRRAEQPTGPVYPPAERLHPNEELLRHCWTTASGCSASIRRSAGSTWISSKRPRRPRHRPGRNCPRRWAWRCVWASLPAWAWPCIGNGRTSGLRSIEEISDLLELPILGVVPVDDLAEPDVGHSRPEGPHQSRFPRGRSLPQSPHGHLPPGPQGHGPDHSGHLRHRERRQEHGGRQPGHHHGVCRAESGGGGRQPAAAGTIRPVRHEPQRPRADLRHGRQDEPGRGHRTHQDRQSLSS